MRENKYLNGAVEVEKKYDGKMKQLIAQCRKEVISCGEIYNDKVVVRKQMEVVDKYMAQIKQVQQSYLNDMENYIAQQANEIAKANEPKEKDNMSRLINALELNNKIAMNNVMFASMTDEELYKLANDNTDSVEVNMIKAELCKRAKGQENEHQLLMSARAIKPVTDESLLQVVITQFNEDKMLGEELMIGMEFSDKLIVQNKAGNIRAFCSQDIEGIEVRE